MQRRKRCHELAILKDPGQSGDGPGRAGGRAGRAGGCCRVPRHGRDRAPVGPGDVAGGPAMAVTELLWDQGDVGWAPARSVAESGSGRCTLGGWVGCGQPCTQHCGHGVVGVLTAALPDLISRDRPSCTVKVRPPKLRLTPRSPSIGKLPPKPRSSPPVPLLPVQGAEVALVRREIPHTGCLGVHLLLARNGRTIGEDRAWLAQAQALAYMRAHARTRAIVHMRTRAQTDIHAGRQTAAPCRMSVLSLLRRVHLPRLDNCSHCPWAHNTARAAGWVAWANDVGS
eukprot:gene5034-biopygen19133